MSTPLDLGTLLGGILSALQGAISTIVNVISANMGTLMTLGITVALAGAAFYLVRRYFGNITRWFTGFFRL